LAIILSAQFDYICRKILNKPNYRMRLRITLIIFSVMLLISCNNGSRCYESTDTLMVTTFTGNNSRKIGPMIIRGFGKNAVGDTLFNNKDSALTKRIALPLSLTSDSTGFVVYVNSKSSTFWVRHSMNIQLISQSCGFAPYYQLSGSRRLGLIDSLKIFNPNVEPKSIETYSTNGQNITVYLHLTAL
jgi:hypothetical protein